MQTALWISPPNTVFRYLLLAASAYLHCRRCPCTRWSSPQSCPTWACQVAVQHYHSWPFSASPLHTCSSRSPRSRCCGGIGCSGFLPHTSALNASYYTRTRWRAGVADSKSTCSRVPCPSWLKSLEGSRASLSISSWGSFAHTACISQCYSRSCASCRCSSR